METTPPTTDQPPTDRHEFFRLVGMGIGAILLMRCVAGCAGPNDPDGPVPDPNPARKIDFSLNLNDKVNENLRTKGGYIIVNDVIVAQTKAGQYVAVAANCTHQGTQLVFKPADTQFYCPLHLSHFDSTGEAVVGPATQPLQRYTVVMEPTTGLLRVTN